MVLDNFIHLKVHSDFSLVDGFITINKIIETAIKYKMPAISITDNMNFFGILKFYNLACNLGIKPIIGTEILLIDKFSKLSNLLAFKITLLITSKTGFNNLKILISQCYNHIYYKKYGPLLERKWLIKYNKGLIILSGGINGDIGKMLLSNNYKKAIKYIEFWNKYFSGYYYFEINRTFNKLENIYINKILELSYKYKIPIVATNNIYFLKKKDYKLYTLKVKIINKNDNNLILYNTSYNKHQYFKSKKKMISLFRDIPQSILTTIEIAKRCNLIINKPKYYLPSFYKNPYLDQKYIIKFSIKGLNHRLKINYPNINIRGKKKIIYFKRLKKELNVINKTNFPSYFLIVMEIVLWAKKNNISVGPGRGSGTGSLVSYCLNITNIDPIKFGLLFERFLNIERISMPDLDIDFCKRKRDLVFKHIIKRYGKRSVSQIITFGKIGIKVAFKDIGRIMGFSFKYINNINKLFPKIDKNFCLENFIKNNKFLSKQYHNNDNFIKLINYVNRIQNIVRNIGTHAGGIVISSPKYITNYTAVYSDNNFINQLTQFDKYDIEYIGLVKFDLLGLKTLTVINDTIININKFKKKINENFINIDNISLEDKNCYKLLNKTLTTGIFQLESNEMKSMIKKFKPKNFNDIVSILALNRPGPLNSGMTNNFINRKNGKEKIFYPMKDCEHLLLKPILEPTYGIIVFQEQVMKIAQVLAGYSLGEADILRKAMGQKKQEELSGQRDNFCTKCENRGIKKTLANKIFDILESFACYGFNKSHSVGYSLLTYQTLWLKTYFPTEFILSLINIHLNESNKLIILLKEANKLNVECLLPNINISNYLFKMINKYKICYGLGAIKKTNKNIILNILKERKKNGLYKNIIDLSCRLFYFIQKNKFNLRLYFNNLKYLIYAGSLDFLDSYSLEIRKYNRQQLIMIIKKIWNLLLNNNIDDKQIFINNYINYNSLFNNILNSVKNILPGSNNIIINRELLTIGCYYTTHPTSQYIKEIKYYSRYNIKNIIENKKKYNSFNFIGIIKNIFINKNLIKLEDYSAEINLFINKFNFLKYKKILKINKIVLISIEINYINKKKYIYINNIKKLSVIRKQFLKLIILILKSSKIEINTIIKLNLYLNNQKIKNINNKTIPIVFFYYRNNIKLILKTNIKVYPSTKLIDKLINILGVKNVKLIFNKI